MHPNLNRASEASCAVDIVLFGFTTGNRCSEHEIPFLAMIPKIEMVDHLSEANSFKDPYRKFTNTTGGPTVTERDS